MTEYSPKLAFVSALSTVIGLILVSHAHYIWVNPLLQLGVTVIGIFLFSFGLVFFKTYDW